MTIKRKDEIYIYFLKHQEKENNESDISFINNLNEEENVYLSKLRTEYKQLQKRLRTYERVNNDSIK